MASLIIYHAGCADGFCSAWICHKALGDVDLHPASYGDPAPDCTGREVYIVDFSYPLDVMHTLIDQAEKLVLLDHHKTAFENLQPLLDTETPATIILDNNYSGAMLTWRYFHGEEPAPMLVEYVQDRDLWRWRLHQSRAINAVIQCTPHEYIAWDNLIVSLRLAPISFAERGQAILQRDADLIARIVHNAREVEIAGHKVLVANTPVLQSEVAGKLAEGRPFGAVWAEKADGTRVYSLRSRDGGIDVSEIAKSFGGGGHTQAAGYEVKP